ncbi:MAG: hypothetical protein ABSH20_17570 [Tepidisphaeraceae bacterium]|jgi:hypothetical protein
MSGPAILASSTSRSSFRIGRVKAYRRGTNWYLCYHENGQRRRPRVGAGREAAKKMAAQINGQLETGVCATLSFEPIAIPELRQRWLDHHEHVLRSSVNTIRRYRAAPLQRARAIQSLRNPDAWA